jgi:hypothetical protein
MKHSFKILGLVLLVLAIEGCASAPTQDDSSVSSPHETRVERDVLGRGRL